MAVHFLLTQQAYIPDLYIKLYLNIHDHVNVHVTF